MYTQETVSPQKYTIKLELDEAQLIFEALAEMPFKTVYVLIGKLNSRANEITKQGQGSENPTYLLGDQDLKLIIQALGAMPFNRVHNILGKLNEQVRVQAQKVKSQLEDADYGYAKDHS